MLRDACENMIAIYLSVVIVREKLLCSFGNESVSEVAYVTHSYDAAQI